MKFSGYIKKKTRNDIVYVWEIAQSMKGYNIFVLENIETVKFCLKKNVKSYFNLIISIEKTYYEF